MDLAGVSLSILCSRLLSSILHGNNSKDSDRTAVLHRLKFCHDLYSLR